MKNKKVYSLGHSNIGIDEFIQILQKLDIKTLMDVRSNPVSTYVPHFNKKSLEEILKENNISYTYCGEHMGGRQNSEFKDFTNSIEYKNSIKKVERIISKGISAIMCSESDFTKCHRRYICSTLIEDGYNVIQVDVNHKKSGENHQLSLGV
ncbi:MAG: DUF488 domain-containing protein [Candidatus Thermoplasmatota archaeon]|nr:DUF488 domain-containing protein [Candidatus Thermoplasmatota archaeon]